MKTDIAIRTLYNIESERHIPFLETYYDNYSILKKIILELFVKLAINGSHLNNKRILIKPNWVRHNLKDMDHMCLTTHPNFILAKIMKFDPQKLPLIINALSLFEKSFSININDKQSRLDDVERLSVFTQALPG